MRETAAIPRYALYDEPDRDAERDFLHVETIAARSSLHAWEIQPHRHRDLAQLFLMVRGSGELRCDERRIELRAPTLIVLPPAVVHGFSFAPDTEGYVLTVSERFIDGVLTGRMAAEIRPVLERVAVFEPSADEMRLHALAAHFEAIASEFVWSMPGRITAIAAHLGLVLAAVVRLKAARASADERPQAGEDELFLRFRQLVEAGFRDHERAIGDYAARLCVSESRLQEVCRRIAGRSPLAVIHARLLAEAQRDLLYTSMSAAEIGYALGFRDPAYFSRFFSRRTGASPAAWRRQHAAPG